MLPGYKIGGIFTLYDLAHMLAFVCVIAFILCICGKFGVLRRQAAVSIAVIFSLAYIWMLVINWVSTGFESFGGRNAVRIYIWLPVFSAIVAHTLKISRNGLFDITAPTITLCNGIGHIGCIFEGCCHGFASSRGIYNATYDKLLFPVQICEVLTNLSITAVLLIFARKRGYQTNGCLYPLMLMLFGSTRFFWEFFRDNKKIIGQVSELALHAASCFVVGAVWLIVLKAREERRAPERQVTP